MESKFTIRDILVYFLTGLTFVILLLPITWDDINFILPKEEKNFPYTTLTILVIPAIYVLGHIIDSTDTLRVVVLANALKPRGKPSRINKIRSFFYFLLVGDRITGYIYFKGAQPLENDASYEFKLYWKKVNYIQAFDKYRYSEYLESLKDLFNSLQSAVLICLIYGLINSEWTASLIYLILLVLFWKKSEYYTGSLVNSVENTYEILKSTTTINQDVSHQHPAANNAIDGK